MTYKLRVGCLGVAPLSTDSLEEGSKMHCWPESCKEFVKELKVPMVTSPYILETIMYVEKEDLLEATMYITMTQEKSHH